VSASTLPVAIVAGVPEELAAVRAGLEQARELAFGPYRGWRGRIAGRDVVLAVAGDGETRAVSRLSALLDQESCAAVLGIGVAGGLSDGLAVSRLVTVTETRAEDAPTLLADPLLSDAARAAGALPVGSVSVRRIVATPEAKRELALTYRGRPSIVDLETHAWATVAAARRLPWAVLRVVSDDAGEPVPEFIVDCQREDGSLDRGRIVAKALAVPLRLTTLLRLRRRVAEAASVLAAAASAIMIDAPSGLSREASREAM
jgi:nucleoside phosphorylase